MKRISRSVVFRSISPDPYYISTFHGWTGKSNSLGMPIPAKGPLVRSLSPPKIITCPSVRTYISEPHCDKHSSSQFRSGSIPRKCTITCTTTWKGRKVITCSLAVRSIYDSDLTQTLYLYFILFNKVILRLHRNEGGFVGLLSVVN